MKKVILVNAYFARNIGDDLFLKVLFDRYPHVQWKLLTANRNYLEVFKDYPNVKITYTYRDIKIGKQSYNLFFLIHNMLLNRKKYHAVINIGGSIFMQGPAWKMKWAERDHLVRKLNTKKAFIIGANFGPFDNEGFVKQYRDLFAEYEDVCFRDSYSYGLFRDMENTRFAPDVVFNFKDRGTDKKEKSIGFSTIHLKDRKGLMEYNDEYNHKIAQLIEGYIESGYNVKLFSFCENEGDLLGIDDIKQQIHPKYTKKIKVVNYTGDYDLFLDEYKHCETIIGTRFHSLILAMLFNQSFYPLIYSKKTTNLLEDLNINNKGCQIEEIKNLDVNKVIATAKLNKMVDEQVFLDANKQFEKLDAYIGQGVR